MSVPEGTSKKPLRFVAACLLPLAAASGLLLGGVWSWLGLGTHFLLLLVLDSQIAADVTPPVERPALLVKALPFLQVPLLSIVWLAFLISQCGSDGLLTAGALGVPIAARDPALLSRIGAVLSFAFTIAMTGTVTAHELVHRTSSPISLACGRFLLAFSFDATFAVEHVYGHHAKVCCPGDPSSARRGESIYHFIGRSTLQSFGSGWSIERQRLARRGLPLWSPFNRNLRGIALSLMLVLATAVAAGLWASVAFVLSGALAKAMLEMINYVEHYGLVRIPGTRVGPRHSWQTAAPLTAAAMFNLGRHAAHHIAPGPYWAQGLEAGAPTLPSGLVLTVGLALVPPVWRGVMAPRLAAWDRDLATPEERTLASAAI
jgi:fatty acid desaturase